MFIGHFAVGFASQRVAPKTSLGTLMIAPLLLDIWIDRHRELRAAPA